MVAVGNLVASGLSTDGANATASVSRSSGAMFLPSLVPRLGSLNGLLWGVDFKSSGQFPGHGCPMAASFLLQASFFVVYNMVTTEVIAVFENTSDELLELFENFCDLFRNATLHSEVQFPCSASSNNFARQIQRR